MHVHLWTCTHSAHKHTLDSLIGKNMKRKSHTGSQLLYLVLATHNGTVNPQWHREPTAAK